MTIFEPRDLEEIKHHPYYKTFSHDKEYEGLWKPITGNT
jgi:hypothetical protein